MRRISMILGSLALALAPVAIAGLSSPGTRSIPGCACDSDRVSLLDQRERIASAATVAQARAIALENVEPAHRALSRARWLAPLSDDLKTASERLERYSARVDSAESPPDVAAEFANLVRLPQGARVLGDIDIDDDADVDIEAGCSFSGGEVIAIVLGFILGIIPGLILLVLLC